jgi:polysaccharide biosynthesis/export protein
MILRTWIAAGLISIVSTGVQADRQDRSSQQPPPVVAPVPEQSLANASEYLVSRLDVLSITLAEEPEVNGKYTVDTDGTIFFPRVGRVQAAGLTVREFEVALRKRLLADGYFLDPHVTVTFDQFRGRRVFVFGGVTGPGMYPLGGGATLLEILAKAGGSGAAEAVVVRSPGAIGPVMPRGAKAADVIRVNLRELEKDVQAGLLSRNIFLEDADTVYVPRVDRNRVYIQGEIKLPGAYSVPEGTTVLELLSLAGGMTESASMGKIKIIRIHEGQKLTVKVALTDPVQPGDTVIVPQRFW